MKTLKSSPSKQQRQSAGKQPTRVPMANVRSGYLCTSDDNATQHSHSPTVAKVTKRKKAKQLKPEAPSTHRMKTRFQTKQVSYFRIRDLPAEIRNQIYTLATVDEQPLAFATFSLPPTLSVSRQLRDETLPIFFAANTFAATIRTNWCVIMGHWHRQRDYFYDSTGVLNKSQLLSKFTPHNAPKEGIREAACFRHVELTLGCACCGKPTKLAVISLHVSGGKATAEAKLLVDLPSLDKNNLQIIFDRVKARVDHIRKQVGFHGFDPSHLSWLAKDFVHEGKAALPDAGEESDG